MTFTTNEQLAIAHVLNHIVMADGRVEHSEIMYFYKLNEEIGLDLEIINQSRYLETQDSINTLKNMSVEKKKGFAIMMREMAEADGNFDSAEREIYRAVFMAAGIDVVKF